MDKVKVMQETYEHLGAALDGIKALCQSSRSKYEKEGFLEDIRNIKQAMLACNEEHQMFAAKWYNVYSRFERLDNESKKKIIELVSGGKVFAASEFNEFVEKYGNGDFFNVMNSVINRRDIDNHYTRFLWKESTGKIFFFSRYEKVYSEKYALVNRMIEQDEVMKILGYKEKQVEEIRELAAQEIKELKRPRY